MAMAEGAKLRIWLDQAGRDAGFDAIHVGPARLPDIVAARLTQFLASGYQGDMEWLADTAARRVQPGAMWGDARTAIIATMNYGPDHDPMDNLAARGRGNISVYARGRDYHDVIKGKLKQVASQFASRSGAEVKVFVDTAPLMEKPLAEIAGAGWQGKHTNLVSRAKGSWLFLGIILTSADITPDQPESDHCGSCTKCLDACPTNAFPAPYRLDARRCISYLTIEHKGQIPVEFRRPIGNRIFGCDDCLAVCPWNKYASLAREAKLRAKTEMPQLAELLALDDSGFRAMFAGGPVRRAGYARFMRNVLIAAGNSGDTGLVEAVTAQLGSPDVLVRGMAVWALWALLDMNSFKALRYIHAPLESDKSVQNEWAQT
jgi:epoxyqueuosine reductase